MDKRPFKNVIVPIGIISVVTTATILACFYRSGRSLARIDKNKGATATDENELPSQSDLTLKALVDANARYAGAYSEINNRITLRQNLITIFATAVTAVLGFSLTAIKVGIETAPFWRLIYGIPFLCIFFCVLMWMHEKQLAILRAYMSELEGTGGLTALTGYHSSTRYAEAQATRRPHDVICFFLCVTALVGSYGVYWIVEPPNGQSATDRLSYTAMNLIAVATSMWLLEVAAMRESVYQRLCKKRSQNPVSF
jgi:hypothetical protein